MSENFQNNIDRVIELSKKILQTCLDEDFISIESIKQDLDKLCSNKNDAEGIILEDSLNGLSLNIMSEESKLFTINNIHIIPTSIIKKVIEEIN
jgi:hypothetical protein